jgi:predicted membrane-bound spermidine synthase
MGREEARSWCGRAAFYAAAPLTGVALQMNWFAHRWDPTRGALLDVARARDWAARDMGPRLWMAALLSPLLFFVLRALLRRGVARLGGAELAASYRRHDSWTYALFALSFCGALGIYADPFVLGLLFLLAQLGWLLRLSPQWVGRSRAAAAEGDRRLLILFLISGFAALVYQVVWQRALFQSFGVNIESVTVIVSVFMFGLGLGSLFGGLLSARFPDRLVQAFVVCEVAIGLFGWFSLDLIERVSRVTLHGSLPVVAAATFGLLCVPTLFMGATLPILVTHLHRTYRSVGTSLSLLYFINTLGSAIASFFCVHVLFLYLGLTGATRVGVLFNLTVAVLAWRVARSAPAAPAAGPAPRAAERSRPAEPERAAAYPTILGASFAVGFVALSLEILWVRLLSFATGSRAVVFGNLLGCYLIGIALGALVAKGLCERGRGSLWSHMGRSMILAAGALYVLPALAAEAMTWIGVATLPLLYAGAGALLTGIVFPILTHLGVGQGQAVGMRVSGVYFANILGATAGPLVTGFWLLDRFGTARSLLLLALLTLGLGLGLAGLAPRPERLPARRLAWVGLALLAGLAGQRLFYGRLLEKVFYQYKYRDTPPFSQVVENRSGIIGVVPEPEGDDIVIGGGVFDGRFNTALTLNRNKIDRAYFVAALHPEPRRILEIGLSSGSWARVFLNHAAVRELDIVEINPGYVEIARAHAESRTALEDPRLRLFIDDGRRWLRRHPQERYDVIVMNTTFYWRSQANNLLSAEFLALCRRHLRPGGVVYFNTTSCADAYYTAARSFPHVVQYGSFVAGSERPFTQDPDEKLRRLARFSYQGRPILEWDGGRLGPLLARMAAASTADRRAALEGLAPVAQLATDDNLATEFKVGRRTYAPDRAWRGLLALWLGAAESGGS